jgi:hypothetical protein
MRYSLRVLLIIFAIAPLLLAWFLAPYFRPSQRRSLLIGKADHCFFTASPTIKYTVRSEGGRRTFSDSIPYGTLDYVVDVRPKSVKYFFSSELSGRVTHRADQSMTQEMKKEFEAVQAFMQEMIGSPETSIDAYLETQGDRIYLVLNQDELPEIPCKR